LRVLQSPPIGELSEPFGEKQVGSSAMPFKRNPIRAEKINSLARYLASLPRIAWDNAAHSLLERTLDDSANLRILLPEAFLTVDELLRTAGSILSGLQVDEKNINANFLKYGPFAATERLLMALTKAGADRQEMHELIRSHAMHAFEMIRQGQENPLTGLLCSDDQLTVYLTGQQIKDLMSAAGYLGDAPQRARHLATLIAETIRK
jgi:adenylosuccinate lyase